MERAINGQSRSGGRDEPGRFVIDGRLSDEQLSLTIERTGLFHGTVS